MYVDKSMQVYMYMYYMIPVSPVSLPVFLALKDPAVSSCADAAMMPRMLWLFCLSMIDATVMNQIMQKR